MKEKGPPSFFFLALLWPSATVVYIRCSEECAECAKKKHSLVKSLHYNLLILVNKIFRNYPANIKCVQLIANNCLVGNENET